MHRSHSRWRIALGLVGLAAGMAVGGAGLAAAGKATTIDVVTQIYDCDSGNLPVKTQSDDFNPTGGTPCLDATYLPTGGSRGVGSRIFLEGGTWQLYLGNQTLRKIRVTLTPVPGSPVAPIPDGLYSANVEVFSRCFSDSAATAGVSFLAILPGTSNPYCVFGFDFSDGTAKYQLAMGPNRAGTGWATVSCINGSGTTCTEWTVVPNTSADVGNPLVANLYRFGSSRGGITLTYIGQYYNTYNIRVAIPGL